MTIVPVIAIIDDDLSIRTALNNLVRSLGYVANIFPSAGGFLQSGQLADTSCVISDVRMPKMNGVELQSHLRARGSRVPFIFITAVPDESIRARALKDGAICFLTKPFDDDVLISCLNRAVAQHLAEGSR